MYCERMPGGSKSGGLPPSVNRSLETRVREKPRIALTVIGISVLAITPVGAGMGSDTTGGHVLTMASDDATYVLRLDEAGDVLAPGLMELGPASHAPRAYVDREIFP